HNTSFLSASNWLRKGDLVWNRKKAQTQIEIQLEEIWRPVEGPFLTLLPFGSAILANSVKKVFSGMRPKSRRVITHVTERSSVSIKHVPGHVRSREPIAVREKPPERATPLSSPPLACTARRACPPQSHAPSSPR